MHAQVCVHQSLFRRIYLSLWMPRTSLNGRLLGFLCVVVPLGTQSGKWEDALLSLQLEQQQAASKASKARAAARGDGEGGGSASQLGGSRAATLDEAIAKARVEEMGKRWVPTWEVTWVLERRR